MPTPTPNAPGWVDAQRRLRTYFGETAIFIKAGAVTFPPNTNIDPSTGQPYDPAIKPTASAIASASANANVFFRSIARGGAAHEASTTAADIRNQTLIMLILDITDRPATDGATQVILRGRTWKITAIKVDGFFDLERVLVYIKQI